MTIEITGWMGVLAFFGGLAFLAATIQQGRLPINVGAVMKVIGRWISRR